jgi:hypothetical protein
MWISLQHAFSISDVGASALFTGQAVERVERLRTHRLRRVRLCEPLFTGFG